MNDLFRSTALWPAEKLINMAIDSDAHIKNSLARFSGKCIEISTGRPSFSFVVFIEADRVNLSSASSEVLNVETDASISGESTELAKLLVNNTQSPLANKQIQIRGDAQLFQDLHSTFQSLDIQWADVLHPIMGDVISNELDQLLRNFDKWRNDAGQRMKRNVNDYLVEESGLFPHPTEIEGFKNSLDELRLNVDRVGARAGRIEQLLNQVND